MLIIIIKVGILSLLNNIKQNPRAYNNFTEFVDKQTEIGWDYLIRRRIKKDTAQAISENYKTIKTQKQKI